MPNTIQEIAKHLGRPLDTACTLIENILSIPTKKLWEMLGDQVSYWQWENRLKIAEKVAAKLKARGISSRQLPRDFVVPFLRNCGDAENPDLQEWWAEMLTSSIQNSSFCHIAFVNILQSMAPADVKFLDTLISGEYIEPRNQIGDIAKATKLSAEQTNISFHNLERLGFFTPTGRRLKDFAFDFLTACYPYPEKIEKYKVMQSKLETHIVAD
ncbi:MAG: hypothetical protein ABSA16_02090 [Thermoguttaceae bacterium]